MPIPIMTCLPHLQGAQCALQQVVHSILAGTADVDLRKNASLTRLSCAAESITAAVGHHPAAAMRRDW
jgi:hypothetical protein